MNVMCPVVTPAIQELTTKITNAHPEAAAKAGFNDQMCAEWVGAYNAANNKSLDFIPAPSDLINFIEKKRNQRGQSFLYTPYSIEYTPKGKQKQTYTIIGTRIFNKNGEEVFPADAPNVGVDRNKIFANLAVQQGRAVVVEHNHIKYVVNNRNQIISTITGAIMKWDDNNGNRREILRLAQIAFREKQKAATPTTSSTSSPEPIVVDRTQLLEELRTKLSKTMRTGRSGYLSVREQPEQYNGYPVIYVSVYNSADDTEFNHEYRLNTEGTVEYRSKWAMDSWKDEWKPVTSDSPVVEYFNTLKQAPAPEASNSIITQQLIDHLKSMRIQVFNRAAMGKYFEDHPNSLVQQAIEEEHEMQDIKAKAIADGTFMKAPNGTPTNLTERQWLQVRTKNFINWFGDWLNDPANVSKVVDENGEPLVVYHHTDDSNLTKFSTDFENYFAKDGGTKEAIFFDEEKTGTLNRKYDLPVFLNIRELNEYNETKQQLHERGTTYREVVNESAKKNNKTGGVHMKDFDDNKKEHQSIWIVHNPNQIKSATDNIGTFSTENDDIQMATDNNKTSNALSIIDEAINTGNWTDGALEELENLNNEEYGTILKRFSQEELGTGYGILTQAEAILSRGSAAADSRTSQDNSRERNQRQEKLIETWAKENGLWYNDYQESKDGSLESVIEADGGVFSNESGSESMVFIPKSGSISGIIKAIDASHYEDIQGLLDKILLHNSLFPETSLEVVGFGRDRGGSFRVIAKQNYVEGTPATTNEISNFITEVGLTKKGGWYYTKDGRRISDLNPKNVIRSKNGALFVIDCDIELTKERLQSQDNIQTYQTPQGEVYGFVDKEGNIYLDETIISPEHPIHEYTHLWDRALEKNNPKLWKRGVKLMQEGLPALWNEIANSESYGKRWKAKGISGEKLINLIASEVHTRIVGENGAQLLDTIAKEKGKEGIIAKLKQWILDAWKNLKATFSNWSQEDIDKLTLKDFNHMPVRDFADGINPNNVTISNPALEQFKKDVELLAGYYEGGGRVLSDDLPSITPELDYKLANHFMGDEPLSIEDYRTLWQLMEFYDDNGQRKFRPKQALQPSTAAVPSTSVEGQQPSPLATTSISLGLAAPTQAQLTAAQQAHIANLTDNPEGIVAQPAKPKPQRPQSTAYESALSTKDSRIKQFRRTFTPQQLKDRGALIADHFSDIIDADLDDALAALQDIIDSDTATEEEKSEARRERGELLDPIGGRQKIVQKKGIGNMVSEIKERIAWSMGYASEDLRILYQNTLDYFTDIFEAQASLNIEEREGIRIIGLELADQTATEEENDEENDGDDETGHTATGSDGWSFQVRYENPFDSLSKKVRSMLYDIERPESENDDLGNRRKYPMGQIYASLLSYLSKNMTSPDDFLQIDKSYEGTDAWGNPINEENYPFGYPTFPVLENMRSVYPWVGQVIQRLTDDYMSPELNSNLRYPSTGGAMASQLYTNFRKAYIPYGKVDLRKEGIIPLNYQMEERAQRDKLVANYNNRMVLTPHSIYDASGTISKKNAQWLQLKIGSLLRELRDADYAQYAQMLEEQANNPEVQLLSEEELQEYNTFIDETRQVLQSFGIDATQDSVVIYLMMGENSSELESMLQDLSGITHSILKIADDKIANVDYILDIKNNFGQNMWNHFFDGRGLITDASYMQSFYDSASKKTKYSYSADNYLMKTFRGVTMGTKAERQKFIEEHYGKYEWFRNQKTGEWKNAWLEYWYNYEGTQEEIPYKNIDNITDMTNSGAVVVRQYTKWTPEDIWQVQDRSYEPDKYSKKTAFYLSPIFSDSPMSMTVMGPRMSENELIYGYEENGVHHLGAFVQLINQELWRIQYAERRQQAIKEGKVKPIANFDDGKASEFCFIPELNTFTFADTNEKFLQRMMRLKEEKASRAAIESAQIEAIQTILTRKFNEYIAENADHYQDGVSPYAWQEFCNMTYANSAIIQLTTIDLAFYRDYDDFQKRFKEVYAGGIQLNTNSKYGKKTENVILLADDIITSPSYTRIASIIDNATMPTAQEKEAIKEVFRDINVADAQAIRSMHSFRSILDMMGKWDDRMEEALNNFKKGTWTKEDFDIIYQTIKPFVYSVIDRNDGEGGFIPVPQQHKNSEICALMMYDLITNDLKSPVYKALSRFMDETVDSSGAPLIDMIQYESAGKVGNQGVINISYNPVAVVDMINKGAVVNGRHIELYTADGENNKPLPNNIKYADQNYKAIKEQLDAKLQEGDITQKEYNKIMQQLRPTDAEIISMLQKAALIKNQDGSWDINPEVVHTVPFDSYYQQQPTPAHHVDAEATFGSQARNIAPADLPEDFEMPLSGRYKSKRTLKGRDEVLDFLYELLNENLLEDFFGKDGKDGLKSIFSSKENLRDAVTEIVRGNPKYGSDFADALQIDPKTNEFVLSPNSPTIFALMQEIITSFFKNRITKQKINGAALIQAAGIGLDDSLRIQFDKNGKVLGAECYMPMTSKRFFEPLLEVRTINGRQVQVLDPEKLRAVGLDKAIGYRIPTENKSSMMPLIIKGFTPQQNGSAIILPAEITAMAGSDFDVDKMFLMLSSFGIQEYDTRKAREDYAKINSVFGNVLQGLLKGGNITKDMLEEDDLENVDTEEYKQWFQEHKEDYRLYKPRIFKIQYDFNKSPKQNGRRARNNLVIQMFYNILTSKPGAEALFNPQGFPDAERAAKINTIVNTPHLVEAMLAQTPSLDDAIKTLLQMSTKELKDFIKKHRAPESPIYPQAFAHLHARNMAGSNQIGIYAIQGSMGAKYQRASIRMKPVQQFQVNGRTIQDVYVSDNGRRLKNVVQMVGASADNGKNPNLTDMGSTDRTAAIIGYMLNAGLSHLEAALIISQPYMQASGYSALGRNAFKVFGKNPLINLKQGNVTTEMLMKNLMAPGEIDSSEEEAIKALCYRVLAQAQAIEYVTKVSRADSPNGSIKNTYAKARIQKFRVDLLQAKMGQRDFPFLYIKEALSNTAVDPTASEDVIREQLKQQPMGFLHGMYALGINSFSDLVAPYFFGADKTFDDAVVKPILYNLDERLGDETLEKVVNDIYTSYITYMLSDSSLFGNEPGASMKSKRDYYLETFPDDYLKVLAADEDIRDLLSSVLQVQSFGSRKKIILQDVGALDKGQKQEIQIRLESLLSSDNEEARKLAKDLLIYSYFDNGLNFTPASFSHLFTTLYLSDFPAYTETLNELNQELTPEGYQNFILQFLLTFPNATYSVDNIIRREESLVDDNTIIIDMNDNRLRHLMVNQAMSPKPLSEGINVYPYISFDGEVFILDQDAFDADSSSAVYHKLEKYATYPNLPLFSRQMTVEELIQEFPATQKAEEEANTTAPEGFIAHDEPASDPAVNSIQDAFNSMDDFDFDDGIMMAVEIPTTSETYTNEGTAELREGFCNI